MKRLKELADKIAAEHGLEWYQPLNKAEDSAGMTAIDLGNNYSLHHEHSENGHDIWAVGFNGERAGTFMLRTEDTRRGKPMVAWAGLEKPHRGKGIGTLAYKALASHYGGLDSDKSSTSDEAVKAWVRAGGRQMKIKSQFGKPRYTLDGDKKNPPIKWNEGLVKNNPSHSLHLINKFEGSDFAPSEFHYSVKSNGKEIGRAMVFEKDPRSIHQAGKTGPSLKDIRLHPDHQGQGHSQGIINKLVEMHGPLTSDSRGNISPAGAKMFQKYGIKQPDESYILHGQSLKKSFDSLIQQAKARLEGVKKVGSQEPRPMIFANKDETKHGFVTIDPSKKNQWRVTHFVKGKPAGHTEAPTFSHAIKAAHDSGYNVFKEIREEEMFKAESSIDEKIYGKHSSVVHLDPYLIKPQNNDERRGSLTDLHLSGKSPIEWAKGIDLSTPIEATMFGDGEVRVSDGHHRQLAAQILHKPVTANLQLINVKNSVLNSQLDSHGKSMTLADKQNRTKALSQEIEQNKAAPEGLTMFTHSLKKSEDKTRVASIVVCSGDKMLMLQRQDNDKWTFPGGHLNNDESFIDGAVRELFEEAGIRANPDEMILMGDKKTFEGKTIHVYLYKVSNEVTATASNDPDKEAKQFKWLPHILPEEIKENLFIPVGENASLSMFMKYLLSQKAQELKDKLKKD